MSRPPKSAYQAPKDDGNIDRVKLTKFLLENVEGYTDHKCTGAFLLVLQEVNSGRLNE